MIPLNSPKKNEVSFYLIIYPTILFFLSTFLFWPQFTGEFTKYMGSVEPTLISFVNFIKDNFGQHLWNQQWYLGFPSKNFSAPIVPYILALVSSIFSITVPHLYRILIGLALILQPISWYFFVLWLTKKPKVAVIFSLIFSFAPSTAYLIPNISHFAQNFYFAPWRIVSAVGLGEGIKAIILTLIPIFLLSYLRALKEPSYKKVMVSSAILALLLLTDSVTIFTSLIFVVSVFFSQIFLGQPEKKFKTSLVIFLLSAGLVSFWYSFSFVKTILSGASLKGDSLFDVLLYFLKIAIAFLPVVLAIFAQKGSRKKENMPLTFTLLSFISFSFIISIFYLSNPNFLTEYTRFIAELDISFALIVSLILNHLIDSRIKSNLQRKVLGTLIVLSIFILSSGFLLNSFKVFTPNKDIQNTIEYQISHWIDKNYPYRSYLSGSSAFWFNLFTKTPQIRGGADQGATNSWWSHASYQIQKGKDSETSLLWLKALRTSAVVVHSKNSQEYYHDFEYPEKFEGTLNVLYDNNKGDKIYKLTPNPIKLTQVVDENLFKSLQKPQKGDDKENLLRYVNALGELSSPKLSESSKSNQLFTVNTEINKGQALAIGITYDSGWKAKVNGKNTKVQKDVLGNILITPNIEGKIELELYYRQPLSNYLGYLITFLTISLLLYYPKNPKFLNSFIPKDWQKDDGNEELEY